MGHVYYALDRSLDRPVALKFITETEPERMRRERFIVEARAIARVQHPNVASVYRVGEVEGRPFIAYELVVGCSLEQLHKPAPWQQVLQLSVGLARGVAAAHARGVLHRDIKPGNVMLSDSGEVKLVDFGIAKLTERASQRPRFDLFAQADEQRQPAADATLLELSRTEPKPGSLAPDAPEQPEPQPSHLTAAWDQTVPLQRQLTRTGSLLGTPRYLPPELWAGEPATTRSDVYAVGLVLYELCTGHLPHAELTLHEPGPQQIKRALEEFSRRIATEDLPSVRAARADLPALFADVVDRCLCRDPQARYTDGQELSAALEHAQALFRTLGALNNSAHTHVPASDAALLRASFTRFAPRADAFTARFYAHLFEQAPQIRALFPNDLSGLRSKFAGTLQLIIESMHDPVVLAPLLEDLGRRHRPYGVVAAHFAVVGRALFMALEEFERDAWSPDLAGAWQRGYAQIESAMCRGLGPSDSTG
jgi:serine/threonine protein kinase